MKSMILMAGLCLFMAVTMPLHAADVAAPAQNRTGLRNVSVAQAEKLAGDTNVIVLDVRTPKEFQEGHIRGATNINFSDGSFRSRLQALDRSRPYLVHCAVGGRSSRAVKTMQEIGFTNIFHLEAGMKAWEKAHKPVER